MEEHRDSKEELNQTEETPQETPQEVPQEYSFLQETIKDEAGGKAKKDIVRIAGLGLVFGIVACISFFALKPWAEKVFQSDPQTVTIPEEKEEDSDDKTEAAEGTNQTLDAESYLQMQQSLAGIAKEAGKSVVTIRKAYGEQNWIEEPEDGKESAAGVIVADNGQELLILGKTSVTEEANEIEVTFCDGTTCSAGLKKRDGTLNLGIYAVPRASVQDSTWGQIKTAVLGSSNSLGKGDPVIALGNPYGYAGAAGFGTITGGKHVLETADGHYRLVGTDLAGTPKGSGILVNLKGEVIGIIDQSMLTEEDAEVISGYGISDVKKIIEFLSNGKGVPYIGIHGVDVTDEIEQLGIPKGVYVKDVEVDSPAMAAGIQAGDIITSIGGTEVSTVAAYHSALMEKESGDKVKIKGQRQGAGGYVEINFSVTVGSKE